MATPLLTAAAARAHETFLALLWALSNPGQIQSLPDADDALSSIGEALVDLETTFYSTDSALIARLARTGARQVSSRQARYQFYPVLRPDDLQIIETAPTGTQTYPDDSATIVIGCRFGRWLAGTDERRITLSLSGPGVNRASKLEVAGIPHAFWWLREGAIRYPLGWDLFLVSENQVVGIPRTTVVEVLG